MKKKLFVAFALIFIPTVFYTKSIELSLFATYNQNQDPNYKKIYKTASFAPEIKLGVVILKQFYLWSSFFSFTSDSTINEIEESLSIKMEQKRILAGIGYAGKGNLFPRIEVGVCRIQWKESAFNETNNGESIGFVGNVGGGMKLAKWLTLNALLGYCGNKESSDIDLTILSGKIGLGLIF